MTELNQSPKEKHFNPQLRQAVREGRFVKELSSLENVVLVGQAGQDLEEIFNKTEEVLGEVKTENKEFIRRQRERLGNYMRDIGEEEIEGIFKEGLLTSIKQQYRLFRKISLSEVAKLNDSDFLKKAITSYSFDFFYSLRMAKNMDVFPSTALEIAKLSYRHNPDALLKLTEKFPEFESSIISRAAVYHPKDPEGFLSKVKEALPKLQTQFPEFEASIITRAAVYHPKDPEGFLSKVKEALPKLQTQFPDLSEKQIIRALVTHHPADTESYLKSISSK